ncbi:hypothetical protein QEH59_06690 [Coraliomargarita sp. SDUM461004]|uniref:Uncharacterized protein n=1 Tax=Thalassobacterium sedimentorum TaxID=3041258 RepID=A0ABU1AIX4_9BACT|nr:hypothetical protein [Coraliomargarita sp. SDUM461004]MDQ8194103.1 hypothetical protein [Coraliomargarita sp. SDUM461004]
MFRSFNSFTKCFYVVSTLFYTFNATVSAAGEFYREDFDEGYNAGFLAGQNGWKSTRIHVSPVIVDEGESVSLRSLKYGPDHQVELPNQLFDLDSDDVIILEMVVNGDIESNYGLFFGIGKNVPREPTAYFGISHKGVHVRGATYSGSKSFGVNVSGEPLTTGNDRVRLRSEWDLQTGLAQVWVQNLTKGDDSFEQVYFDAEQTQKTADIGDTSNASEWSEVYLRMSGSTDCSIESICAYVKGAQVDDPVVSEETVVHTEKIGKPSLFPLSEEQKAHLVQVVDAWRFPYDSEKKLLLIPKPKAKFKTNFITTPMHSIRWSLEYAVTLMDSGDEAYRQRALDIIDVVLQYQNTDPTDRHYGLWPDFLEISMEDMQRVDGNTADFLGIALIGIRFVHGDRIPDALKERIDVAIKHAAVSVMHRDITVTYTNPAMMSLVVTLVAGDAYDMKDVKAYGLAKAKKILDYTVDQGSFTEYNSPNYLTVVINALQRVRSYVRDPRALKIVDQLYYMAWKHAAVRFHPPTRQWSGPNSRSYQELLPEGYQAMIDSGLSGQFKPTTDLSSFQAGFEHRLFSEIPESLHSYFTILDEPREVVERFEKSAYDWMPDVIGTTWLTPEYSIGTVNRGDMWEQRRNLQVFWGNSEDPAYLRTRFMKDDYDFSSVNFFSAQEKNRVLAALNFSTNGGDRHLFQDAIRSGRFDAKSLRLRFELGGSANEAEVKLPDSVNEPVVVKANGMYLRLQSPFAKLQSYEAHWETGSDGKVTWLDLVLYDGPKQSFSLAEINVAALGFSFAITNQFEDLSTMTTRAKLQDGRLYLSEDQLLLSIPVVPNPKEAQQASVHFIEDK